ncbi:ribonuclease H-like domain-containing protein [Tanacetum coccineum]
MSQPANDVFSQHLSDDEASFHEDASENGTASNKPKQQQQQLIPTTTTISNIKLPILKKEEYDIWAMEMEHYLEYIDNDVWKVIQNGNSKKRISTGKDGVIRVLPPVSAAEIHAVEKERKARTILLMAIPKEHLRRFHGMDDAKEIWEAIRTRFGGNANSKKMQKAVLKQQFEAFTISSSEGLEKGYDRFQQLLSQLEAHGAEVSTEDANHKFLRSLPPAWSNLAMTMRTKPDVDTLSIDDLYNNLRVFEQELTSTSKSSASAQNVAFVSHSKSSTNKVKSGHTGAYSTYTPSTSSNNIPEREVPAGFADEVIYSLFAKQSEDLDLLHEDLEQIDDVDIEEMDINWQIAMIAIRMKKFYKKTGRRVRIDGNKPVGFDKKKLECFKCHNTGHFARECPSKGTNDGKKRDLFIRSRSWKGRKNKNQNVLGGNKNKILAYTLAVKKLEAQVVTFQKQQLSLNEQLAFQANEIYAKDEKLKKYRRIGMKAIKRKRTIAENKDNNFIGVPHPLYEDYTPKHRGKFDDSLYVNGKKGPQKHEISDSDDNSTEHSTCQSNDSEGSFGNPSEHSSESESESISVPNEMSTIVYYNLMKKVVSDQKKILTKNIEDRGGSVTFGGSKGYITGKGRIRVGNLDFDSCIDNGRNLRIGICLNSVEEQGNKQSISNCQETSLPKGVAEIMNMTLIEAARTMLTDSLLPTTFWAEAVSTACYIFNREEDAAEELIVVPTVEVAVSPIPTLRIHNIHPQSQILGDLKSSVQKLEAECKQHSGAHTLFRLQQVWIPSRSTSWSKVKQKTDGIFISQDKYVADMLKKFDLASVKTAITPMETKMALTKDEEADEVDVTPKTSHLNAVKRIFKYLKGKPNLGLWYPRESSFDLEAYSDSDYAGANLDRKSITGGCQFLGSRLISWQCKKQTIVATSTTEAEYVAAASCCGNVWDSRIKCWGTMVLS